MPWLLGRCATCASAAKHLRYCGRCLAIAYCGEECQVEDFPEHRDLCNEILQMEDASSEDEEDGAPIISVCWTPFGLVCPGKKRPNGVPKNFGLFQAAGSHILMDRTGEEEDFSARFVLWQRQPLGEVDYLAFYKDISMHSKQEWTTFFQEGTNKNMVLNWISLLSRHTISVAL